MSDYPHLRRRAVLGELVRIVVLMVLVSSVWATGFEGRQQLVNYQRTGCERGKLDRAANARAWRQAQLARARDGDEDVARLYGDVASGLEKRSRIDCNREYPDPKLLQL